MCLLRLAPCLISASLAHSDNSGYYPYLKSLTLNTFVQTFFQNNEKISMFHGFGPDIWGWGHFPDPPQFAIWPPRIRIHPS